MPRTKNGGFFLDDSELAPYTERAKKDLKKISTLKKTKSKTGNRSKKQK